MTSEKCLIVIVLMSTARFIFMPLVSKLSFTNIWGLSSNFVDIEFFLEPNSPDIIALYETNLDGSVDFGNFSVRSYIPSFRKDSTAHMHGLAVSVKEHFLLQRNYL